MCDIETDAINSTRAKLPGRFYELNIHYGVFVGGMGDFNEIFLGNQKNFRGCLENLFFNGIEVLVHSKKVLIFSYTHIHISSYTHILIFTRLHLKVMLRAEDESSGGGKAKVNFFFCFCIFVSFVSAFSLQFYENCSWPHKDYVALSSRIQRYVQRYVGSSAIEAVI